MYGGEYSISTFRLRFWLTPYKGVFSILFLTELNCAISIFCTCCGVKTPKNFSAKNRKKPAMMIPMIILKISNVLIMSKPVYNIILLELDIVLVNLES